MEKNLTPEGELMYRIIEQWGNVVAMPQMEGWIREYGDNRVKAQTATFLPANDAVQNWFEENITKDCSASSAIYKFRQWLEELQGAQKQGPVWVKASEFKYELEVVYHAKYDDNNKGAGYFNEEYEGGNHLFIWQDGADTFQNSFHRLLILDESATPAAPGWTPATTKPEHNVGVLVFIPGEDNHITSGMWDISNEWVLLDEYRTPEDEVTYWMPLPAFPEGHERY